MKVKRKISSRVIYHTSTLGIIEVQQVGVARLDARAFTVQLDPNGKGPGLDLGVAFHRIQAVKAFQKKSSSSSFYIVEIEYVDNSGALQSITLELRVFLRQSQALKTAKAWKQVFATLQEEAGIAPAEQPESTTESTESTESSEPAESKESVESRE
ncbi:hypothetical protein [Oceanidesulfovibrio marinus]|uniref:Uncharacterized protein n=1 Tax=Oceanidesulfovibrio marinus TaxID=370038 RepID=A0ABX6NJP2_9BACT|nr:hypothetical protein [Oceanidesulfovibrio marinus]QJT10822.1 hypothetical protein E8L03_18715 [Oceanidesulfovibrio marinus]